jgi:hypothetical protein
VSQGFVSLLSAVDSPNTSVTFPSSIVALLTDLPAFCAAASAADSVGFRLRTVCFGACSTAATRSGDLGHDALA